MQAAATGGVGGGEGATAAPPSPVCGAQVCLQVRKRRHQRYPRHMHLGSPTFSFCLYTIFPSKWWIQRCQFITCVWVIPGKKRCLHFEGPKLGIYQESSLQTLDHPIFKNRQPENVVGQTMETKTLSIPQTPSKQWSCFPGTEAKHIHPILGAWGFRSSYQGQRYSSNGLLTEP